MTYFALIDENNFVTQVIVGHEGQDAESSLEAQHSCKCKKAKRDGSIRGVYPGPGYFYDEVGDFFIKPSPYPSWQLNRENMSWGAPVEHPNPEHEHAYDWEESELNWVLKPAPAPSWQLNEDNYLYEAPVPKPDDLPGDEWIWDEEILDWVLKSELMALAGD